MSTYTIRKLPHCQFHQADNSPQGGHDCGEPATYLFHWTDPFDSDDSEQLYLCDAHAEQVCAKMDETEAADVVEGI